jgi:hypothetical protein
VVFRGPIGLAEPTVRSPECYEQDASGQRLITIFLKPKILQVSVATSVGAANILRLACARHACSRRYDHVLQQTFAEGFGGESC